MTAGDVCNRQVVIATPDMTIVEAADLMKAHHVGDLVVVGPLEGGRVPIGILTDRDIALSAGRLVRDPQLTILRIHTSTITLAPDFDLTRAARVTPGFSGADLANVVNEAALLAARRNAEA